MFFPLLNRQWMDGWMLVIHVGFMGLTTIETLRVIQKHMIPPPPY